MVMKRFAVVLGLVVLAGACNKPSEESCRKAMANVRKILGTDSAVTDVEAGVRRCKGGSSKKTVECAINATTREQLKECGFFKVPEGGGSAAGSAAGSGAGSAGGSAN
jgi:hypothetical protein